jgi:hypothetical protein
MQEKQPPAESIREQTLKKFRSERSARLSGRKKRVSTGIFVINIAIIILLYIFFIGKKPGEEYRTTSFNYRDTAFRFSMSRGKDSGDYVFYLSARAAGSAPATIRLSGGLADLNILCGSDIVMTAPIGGEIATLTLKPAEPVIRKQEIDTHELMLFAESHPDRVVTPARSLLQFKKPYLPLTAEIRIRTDPPVSTSINFTHEVEQ